MREREDFEGQAVTRMAIALALGRIDQRKASAIAQERWGDSAPTLCAVIKANEVAGGGTGSGEWGAELVSANTRFSGDFVEYLGGKTLFDTLPLRQVPRNVVVRGQDLGATAFWVGESKAIPTTNPSFSDVDLSARTKVAALAIVSNDLLRYASPSAEMLVRDALVNASALTLDTTFFSTAAASTDKSPAGLLNGLSAIPSAATSADGVRADVSALVATFITAKNLNDLRVITTPAVAAMVGLMSNADGTQAFPNVTAAGGALLGYPLLVSDAVPAGYMIMLAPRDIWRSDDNSVDIAISNATTVEMNSAPLGATDTPVAASTTLVSLFQTDSSAIKVVRPVNFAKRHASAVAYVSGIAYRLGDY